MRKLIALLSGATLLSTSGLAVAQDNPNAKLEAETARLNAEAAVLNAEAALSTAEATKTKARIDALGLPKFENNTDLKDGAGEIEASLMATVALKRAAITIVADAKMGDGTGITIATQESKLNSWQLVFLRNMIRLKHDQLIKVCESSLSALQRIDAANYTELECLPGDVSSFGPVAVMGAINAAAGLFESETTVSNLKIEGIGDDLLAKFVKTKASHAWLASATDLAPAVSIGCDDFEVGSECPNIMSSYVVLVGRNSGAKLDIAQLTSDINGITVKIENEKDATKKARLKRLKSLIETIKIEFETATKEIDDFGKEISKLGDGGFSPLTKVAMTERALNGQNPKLLKVNIARIGGSTVYFKNIGTMFGDDPLRIGAGLIVSWTLEKLVPVDQGDQLQASGVIICRTAPKSFRRIQHGNWLEDNWDGTDELCLSDSSIRPTEPQEIETEEETIGEEDDNLEAVTN